MWKCASVALLLALCSAGAIAESPLVEVDMDTDVCAMTDVLVAMNKLLVLLSTEIRDLRDQVKNSCHSSGTTCTNATTTATTASPSTVVEAVETQGKYVLSNTSVIVNLRHTVWYHGYSICNGTALAPFHTSLSPRYALSSEWTLDRGMGVAGSSNRDCHMDPASPSMHCGVPDRDIW